MFFLLSKLLNFLLNPLIWVFTALFFGLRSKKPSRKRYSFFLATILLFIFSNEFFFNTVINWWEVETIQANEMQKGDYDIAILLGGYGDANGIPAHDRFVFGTSANRFTQTLELYRTGKIKRILLTGGKSDIKQKNRLEAIAARELLLRLGIPDSVILLETNARNTRENALFSKQILDSLKYENCLLVTSAFHMKRAKACFDKVGISYTPYAADYKSKNPKYNFGYFLKPNPNILGDWEILLKEWVGLVAYKIVGYV